jgi:excisionase family DNA binding protein
LVIGKACLFLNLAKPTLHALTSKRKIPFIKKGKKLYFKKMDLEEWLNEGKKKTVSEIEMDIKWKKF